MRTKSKIRKFENEMLTGDGERNMQISSNFIDSFKFTLAIIIKLTRKMGNIANLFIGRLFALNLISNTLIELFMEWFGFVEIQSKNVYLGGLHVHAREISEMQSKETRKSSTSRNSDHIFISLFAHKTSKVLFNENENGINRSSSSRSCNNIQHAAAADNNNQKRSEVRTTIVV